MIALLILGVALVGFVQGTTTALSSSKDAEVQTTAVMLASGRMEQVQTDGELEDGETEGEWGDDYPNFSWRQTIAPGDVRGLHEVSVVVEDTRSGKQIYELRTMLFEVPPATDEDSTAAPKKKKRKGADE
jgi:hypothetical protein